MGMDWIDKDGASVANQIHAARYRDRGTLSRSVDRLLEVARAARDLATVYQTTGGDAIWPALDRLVEALDYDPRPSRGGDTGGDKT